MRKGTKGLLLGFLLILSFMLAACSDDEKAEGNSGTDGVKEVTIGYSGPLSGPAAFYGNDTLNGLKMAADDINDGGGFEVDGTTYKIKLAPLDDKYLPNETAANAKRLSPRTENEIRL